MPTLEQTSEASAVANEQFAKDMRDVDWHWLNGRLPEWIAKQIEEDKPDAGDGGNI